MPVDAQVLQADDRRFEAMRSEDWATFDAVLADELTYCHSTARLETKAEHMANLKARKPRYVDATPRERKVRVHGDMGEVEFPPASFDAVTAVYSLFHLPRERHPALFTNVRRWLRPDGKFLFTYATRHYTGADEFDGRIDFMGKPLYYSHDTRERLREILAHAGLAIEDERLREIGGETFLWVTATAA